MARLRVVVAPDSFKGTASAAAAARAIADGWLRARPDDELTLLPMADGGEGTLDAFAVGVPDAARMPVTVRGPGDDDVAAHWLLLPDGTGVVELATTSGITLLDPLRPTTAHTYGFGRAIAAALDHGVRRLLLAIGGSASTDGGAGMLLALGARVEDAAGAPVPLGNAGLADVALVDLSTARRPPAGGALALGDVTNPLLGPAGAAAVFGPQKGADAATVEMLEANLAHFARLVPVPPETPGAGAAGGTGFALLAWGAGWASGAGAVGDCLDLPGAVAAADVVVTGEGRYDAQTGAGKVASYVQGLATAGGSRAMLVAGLVAAPADAFDAAVSLTDLAGDGDTARADALRWLTAAGERLAAGC